MQHALQQTFNAVFRLWRTNPIQPRGRRGGGVGGGRGGGICPHRLWTFKTFSYASLSQQTGGSAVVQFSSLVKFLFSFVLSYVNI